MSIPFSRDGDTSIILIASINLSLLAAIYAFNVYQTCHFINTIIVSVNVSILLAYSQRVF